MSMEHIRQELDVLNKQIEKVTSFKYLGSLGTEENSIPTELRNM